MPTPNPEGSGLDQAERVPEWRSVTGELLDSEILPTRRPAVLRGVGARWPVVERARESAQSLAGSLASFHRGEPVVMFAIEAAAKGRMFYSADMKGFNFSRSRQDLKFVLNRLLAEAASPSGEAIAVQAAASGNILPDFRRTTRSTCFRTFRAGCGSATG